MDESEIFSIDGLNNAYWAKK